MPNTLFRRVVSLGPNCRSKYQMQRVYGWMAGPRLVFDWQVTPPGTIIDYLRRDFRGMFERDDLELFEGTIRNKRFRTTHQHEFPAGVTIPELDDIYPRARLIHDRLCRRTRRAMGRGEETLFVLAKPIPEATFAELDALIRERRRGRPYLLLRGPEGDRSEQWSGDDALWSRHLGPYSMGPTLRMRVAYRAHRIQRKVGRHFGLAAPGIPEHPVGAAR